MASDHVTGMNRWIIAVILIALLLSSLPYLFGYYVSNPDHRFMGLTYNIDDACVYLSWMRQAADGSLLIRNQFAVEQQQHLQFNILFLLLGWLARLFHLPLIAVFHIARLGFGALLLWSIYRFGGFFFKDERQRLALLIIVAFSSGIGWMFGAKAGHSTPVDMWQPEAITFLSLYLNPLFLWAQILMIGTLACLLRCRETGQLRHGITAGLLLLLLANTHTYDVVTVGVVWVGFLVALWISAVSGFPLRSNPETTGTTGGWRLVGSSALALLIASPALLYQYYLYHSEEVFRLRAETQALSPEIWLYFAGFGMIFALAVLGLPIAVRSKGNALLPAVWAVVGFLLPYAPVAQQRKLIMGLHIGLSILAIYGLTWLLKVSRSRHSILGVAFVVSLWGWFSNCRFIVRDMNWLSNNETATRMHRPFLTNSEIAGLQWLDTQHSTLDTRQTTVLAFPDIACFIPAMSGKTTYVGHWSETPDFGRKLRVWRDFASSTTSDESRVNFLKRWRIDYVWWNTAYTRIPALHEGDSPEPAFRPDKVDYLKEVFRSEQVRIYYVSSRVGAKHFR